MGTFFCLAQIIAGTPDNDVGSVGNKVVEDFLKGEQLRPIINHRQEDDAKAGLHIGMLVELINHHFRHLIAFKPNGHAHAITVGFIPNIRDAGNHLIPDQLGDLFHQLGLVHLVGQFSDHNGFLAVFLIFLHLDFGPQRYNPPAGVISLKNPLGAVDMAIGGKIRCRDMGHQCPCVHARIVYECF